MFTFVFWFVYLAFFVLVSRWVLLGKMRKFSCLCVLSRFVCVCVSVNFLFLAIFTKIFLFTVLKVYVILIESLPKIFVDVAKFDNCLKCKHTIPMKIIIPI